MNRFLFPYLIILFLIGNNIYGQTDSSKTYTPFIKGRSIVALNGSISSSTDNRSSVISGSEKVLNNYSFNARLAKIVARNFALGLAFSTEKYSSKNHIQFDTEVLTLGPWCSYYFTNGESGGLFVQGAVLFVNYYEESRLLNIWPNTDEQALGQGGALGLGFGYTYVMFDRIGLELSMNYRYAKIYGDIASDGSGNSAYGSFDRTDINFNFGFIVLFNKLKKHE